jgi:chromosomal replication initiation ATPase DnaA
MLQKKYEHKKNLYVLVGEGKFRIDEKTWEVVIIYRNQEKPEEFYVRRKEDFESSFIPVLDMESLTSQEIIDGVCSYFQVTREQISSPIRVHTIMIARFALSVLLRRIKKLIFQQIGDIQGGRDHATIMNQIRAHDNSIDTDESYRIRFRDLCEHLNQMANTKFKKENE